MFEFEGRDCSPERVEVNVSNGRLDRRERTFERVKYQTVVNEFRSLNEWLAKERRADVRRAQSDIWPQMFSLILLFPPSLILMLSS